MAQEVEFQQALQEDQVPVVCRKPLSASLVSVLRSRQCDLFARFLSSKLSAESTSCSRPQLFGFLALDLVGGCCRCALSGAGERADP